MEIQRNHLTVFITDGNIIIESEFIAYSNYISYLRIE
ncbi:MAG: hypothetical protein K0S18_607 [Anaerocolumna sp.]|jgi:hypothetical protein|nr:hypothetical protein [Clostridia bacterium]MDF2951024.1 hypothetical protein [Anaerocolumna sp.]